MFVTFEGPEGAGKTSVMHELAQGLAQAGHRVRTTREPGEGEVGGRIREILLHGAHLDPWEELFLFLADRAHHCRTVIRPALDEGVVVLCDRFADSTVVYQGHAGGLDLEVVRELNHKATRGLVPDLTLLLDVAPEVGLSRLRDRDRMDALPVDFHHRVREGFLAEAAREPDRWVVVQASQPIEKVVVDCRRALERRLR